MKKKDKVIAVVGPTASGKSELALQLAEELNGEIISADSRQIYKEFDIATAKPAREEMRGIPHHMLDIVEPTQEFTVADFADGAHKCIEKIIKRGKVPIIAGGTGLYFRTLLQDFDLPRVEPDKELRAELENFVRENGVEALYNMLLELDPASAQKIHPNNSVKIIRALEVTKILGMPMSQAQGIKEAPYEVEWIGLNTQNRQNLYDRINQRVDKMCEKGLVEEAKNLFQKYGALKIMMETIGYKELYPYFQDEIALEEALDNIRQNSRRYAKRQLTWFRANPDIHWFEIDESENILEGSLNLYNTL